MEDACHIIRVGGWKGASGAGGMIVSFTPDFVESAGPSFLHGDCDQDSQIDLGDAAAMVSCLLGPHIPSNACCQCASLTIGDDVSLADYAVLQNIFGEP
jgi:hypothetical protein